MKRGVAMSLRWITRLFTPFLALLLTGILSSCAGQPDRPPEGFAKGIPASETPGYKEHGRKTRTCSFGDGRKDLYQGYHVNNHILAATEQGTIKNDAIGGARNDFRLNFLRIFNCYRNFRQWQETSGRSTEGEAGQVLFYFNGGLNPENGVREQAAKQVPRMLEDGYFPVFMIWPTGPFDTYLEQILKVRNGVRGNANALTALSYLVDDLGQGTARAPVNFANQFQRFVNTEVRSGSNRNRREFYLERTACYQPRGERRDQDLTWCDATDVEKFGIIDGRITAQRNLLAGVNPDEPADRPVLETASYAGSMPARFLSTPLIDAFGKTMWENMVRRTRTTIRRPVEFNIHLAEQETPEEAAKIAQDLRRFPNGLGAFARFFTMLEDCIARYDRYRRKDGLDRRCYEEAENRIRQVWRDSEITVIGHSMGTIVMNEVIPLHPKLPYRNLVFMASAASVRDTAAVMVPFLKKFDAKLLRFYSLMLHPQNDARELVAYGAAPSGSLLAWIDEMFEGPKTSLDRTMGKWRNLRSAKHVFPLEVQEQILFRVFGWKGDWATDHGGATACLSIGYKTARACQFKPPTTHGAFNNTGARFWCPFFLGRR